VVPGPSCLIQCYLIPHECPCLTGDVIYVGAGSTCRQIQNLAGQISHFTEVIQCHTGFCRLIWLDDQNQDRNFRSSFFGFWKTDEMDSVTKGLMGQCPSRIFGLQPPLLPNSIAFRPPAFTGCTSVTDGQTDRLTDHVTVTRDAIAGIIASSNAAKQVAVAYSAFHNGGSTFSFSLSFHSFFPSFSVLLPPFFLLKPAREFC